MNHSTIVTVVVPVFQPESFLTTAIQSVIDQTFKDWELVVVDDGSSFDVTGLIPRDVRVRLIRQNRGGPSIARNTGILSSSAEFIAFLDADDLWQPNKLQEQIAVMRAEPDVQFVYSHAAVITADGTELPNNIKCGDCFKCCVLTLFRRPLLV